MWKDYSKGYIKNNRSSSAAVMLAAFISALLLSLLCGLFYNAWKYEIERIRREEGGWQSRIAGEFDQQELAAVRNFASVADVVVKEDSIDIYFDDIAKTLEDTPKIAELAGASPEMVTYHHKLLAMYLIRDPQDTAPRLVFPLFILITLLASFSLILVIHNAFAVSMNARIHQFGILSSVGATPGQIRICLLQEAAALCAAPALAGNLLGIIACMGILQLTNALMGNAVPDRQEAVFGYHPLVLALTLLVTVFTIWISAWLPARKLSRLTPLEAIKSTGELQLKRRKRFLLPALLFGVEGELAGNAYRAQRKTLRTASFSLVFSFLAFTIMQCFFTMSGISTRETYFERYQDVWDLMITVKDTDVDAFGKTEEIQKFPGVESVIVYQKAMAKRIIAEDEMSAAMRAMGGFSNAAGNEAVQTESGWLVDAPVVILDDAGFLEYCMQIGIAPSLDGAVIRNRIRDVTNPNFRHPEYLPYVKGENVTSVLRPSGKEGEAVEIPILSYTEEEPVLREKYASPNDYELVHFIPVSLWQKIKGQVGGLEKDTYIRILGEENAASDGLDALQSGMWELLLEDGYQFEIENRIQEQEVNDKQIWGMRMILGGFCVLLAMIGIGSIFSNTLGFVRQRKREFARYMSVGMTPQEIRKMFFTEALIIAMHPVLFTLPPAAATVWWMLRMSYLGAEEFFAEAPLSPVAVFICAVWGAVALAYYLGWRNVGKMNLAEVLRDDTMI